MGQGRGSPKHLVSLFTLPSMPEELASLAQEAIAATGCEPQEELQAGTGGIVPSDSSFAWVFFGAGYVSPRRHTRAFCRCTNGLKRPKTSS